MVPFRSYPKTNATLVQGNKRRYRAQLPLLVSMYPASVLETLRKYLPGRWLIALVYHLITCFKSSFCCDRRLFQLPDFRKYIR